MANELGTGGLLGSLTGKTGANASSAISHHTAMVTGASGRAKDAAAPMITIGNMTVNNDSSNGSVIKTVEKNNQYKPADTSTLKMGGFFSTATGKLESAINKQTELIEKQSAVISNKLEGIQAAVADVSQAISKAMNAQISAFEEYSAFDKKQNSKTTLVHDIWMVISKGAREKEAATKRYFNSNQQAIWSKSDTFSLTKTLPNALAKINENLVTRFTDPKVRRTLISETLKHYQRVYTLMQTIATEVENIRYNTHPIDQYVKHEFDVYNRANHLGIYDPQQQQPIPPRQEAKLTRNNYFDTLTADDIKKVLTIEAIFRTPGGKQIKVLGDTIRAGNNHLTYGDIISDKSYITDFLSGNHPVQQRFRSFFVADRKKKQKQQENQKKELIGDISDKNLKALIAPTEELTKATMLSASSNGALQSQMKNLGLAVDTNTSTVEKVSLAMSAAMKLLTRFVNFKSIGSLLLKVLKFYSMFRMGKSVLGLARGGIGLASSGVEKISSGFNWLKDRVPFVKSISDAIAGWWEKAKNYFHEKIGTTIETYVTTPIVGKITNLFDGVFGSGTFDKTLTTISEYSRAIFTAAFGKNPASREEAWSTLKNGITNGFETIVKKYIIPAITQIVLAIYSLKNFPKTIAKIPKIPGVFRAGVNNLKTAWAGSEAIDADGNVIHKGGLNQGSNDLFGLHNAFVRGASNVIHGTGPKATNAAGQTVNNSSTFNAYKFIGSAPKKAWGAAKSAYTSIKQNGFKPAITQSLTNAFTKLKASITGLPGNFVKMKNAFGGFGGMLMAGGKGFGGGILKSLSGGTSILTSLLPLAKGLAKLATGVGIPIAIIAFLMKMIMPAFKSAQSKGIGVGQYLKDTVIGWFEKLKKTINTELGGFGGIVKTVMSGIVGVLEGIWIGIKSLFNANSAAGLILNIGKALVDGLIAALPFLLKMAVKSIKMLLWDIPKALLWDLPKMIIDAVFGGGGKSKKSKVVPHAKGGIVDSPTYFKFAKGGTTQTGLMGEAGPEAILKLKKGKDGVLGVSIADSSNSLQQAIKLLDRTNAVTSSAMRRLTDAITRPNSFYDPKTVKQFTSTFKKLDISSDRLKLLSDVMTRNAGKEITVDNINELAALLYDINTEQTSGNTDTFNQVKALIDSQTKANKDQSKRDTERNKTLINSQNVTKTIKENLPDKGFWDSFTEWMNNAWDDFKRSGARFWSGLFTGDYDYVKMTDAQSIAKFGATVNDVATILDKVLNKDRSIVSDYERISKVRLTIDPEDYKHYMEAKEESDRIDKILTNIEKNLGQNITDSDAEFTKDLIKANTEAIFGDYDPFKIYDATNLVSILKESKKFSEDTLEGVKEVLNVSKGALQGEKITDFMAAINKTPDFSEDTLGQIKQIILDQNGEQVTEDTMKSIVKIVTDIKDNQEEAANNDENNKLEQMKREAAEKADKFKETIQKQIKSIKEYFVGGKFFADIDKAKMTVGGIMKTIGSSIYNLVTGKQNTAIGNALKDTFGAGFGGLAAGLMGDSKAYELMNKINENAVKHGHSDVQRMMTSARHTILSDVSDIAQFTKDTKITSEELASILKDAEKYGWNISSESFKKLDAQIKGIPYVPEGKDGKTNTQTEGTSNAQTSGTPVTQGNDGKVVSSNNAGQIVITTPTSKAKRLEFKATQLDESSKTSLLDSIKIASGKATSDQEKATYSKLSEAVSTGRFESLSSSDWETLKDLSPRFKDAVSGMQETINKVRFETYTHKLLNTEGGYVSYKDKYGNLHEDNRGISKNTLKEAIRRGIVPADTNIKDLTAEQAIKIYRQMYWDVEKGPKMDKLPHPIDYLVYDTHVNGGALDVLRNTLKKLGVNGYDKAGFDKTFGAVIDYCQSPEKTKKFGEEFLIARGKYYIDVVKRDNTKSVWLKGWFKRLENISKQTGLESPFKDGTLVDEANKLLNEIGLGKSTAGKSTSSSDSTKTKVDELVEQSPKQATINRDDLVKNIGQLLNAVRSSESTLQSLSQTDVTGEYSKEWAKARDDLRNLDNLYEKANNGSPITESDVKLLNDATKTYGETPFDYGSYKTAVVDSTKVEVNKQVERGSKPFAKPTAVTAKPVNQPTANANGTVKVEAQTTSAARKAKEKANRVKIDDRFAGFVQNLVHETELDIQGKSWYESESSERSKLETLTKVLDEINSGSLSADTRNFLNENKDKFESYLSMNAKATQFKMSDAARSGLIELLKKKQDIAAKDKDGGLLTSNSTMVSAKREYEALGKAIKEVQTDSLTNASMDLLFGDKELYKYVKNLSYQPTAIDEAFSKEIPDAAFDLSKTAEKANIKHQQMVQQALEQVTDEDFKKNPYTSLQNAVEAIKNATALQYVALTKMERPNVANVSNATVSTNNNSSVYANQSNMGNNDNIGLIGLGMYSGSDAILSSSPIW